MKYRYLLSIFIQFFYLYTGDCQVDFVPSSCGLFSPYQVDMGKYLRFDEHIDVAGMDVDIANYKNNSAKHDLQIDLLINIFASGDIVRHPLNLCFVLDRSASMAENHRMEKLKTALKYILSKLTTDDYISIVAYDDLAQVILPSRRYNPAQDSIFKAVIDRIPMGGGTNMSAGMFKGYEELNKHYNPLYKNRMILMSDGVPNTGEQDPQRIIQYSTVQYNKGIETSTIGLGNNINFELLYNISVEGRGTSYFVGDCDSAYIDIGAVLKEELNNLNANMEKIRIKIDYPKHLKFTGIYGVTGVVEKSNSLIISPSDLLAQSQFMMLKFQTKKKKTKNDLITINFSYTENGTEYKLTNQISCFNPNIPSYQISLMNRIIDAVNCVKHKLLTHQSNIGYCLGEIINDKDVSDKMILLKQLIGMAS